MDSEETIKGCLAGSPYDLRTVKFHMDGKKVILTGTVRSFYMKQIAQETVRLDGCMVVNRLIVKEK